MKIVVVSTNVFPCPPPGYSGLEMIAWQCAEGLAKLGHNVLLAAPDGSRCDHATHLSTGPAGQWDEARAFELYHEACKQADVVIDHTWNKWAYVSKAQGGITCPVLGVMHAPVDTMYRTLPPGVERPCFVCISQDQASHFEALFGRPARVAYNGVDLDFYRPIEGLSRTDRFLFLARFSSIKGPDIAIDACKAANVGLDLVGDTSITGEPDYLNACRAKCDGKQIVLHGSASRGACVHWYSTAHAMIHPNLRFREPFGLAPVEAMACGVPVIAWNYGAVRETLRDGAGWLVDSVDELTSLLRLIGSSGPRFLDSMRPVCRENAARFSVQNMVKRYETLCQEAVGGGW